MGHDDRREIFERLEALERLARSRSGGHEDRGDHRRGDRDRRDHHRDEHHRDDRDDRRRGHDRRRDDDDRRERGGGDFNEKRVIDTIVKLVGERLERFIQDQQAKSQRRDDGDHEKRTIDLVVRLVGEHVREIVQVVVSNELDRRRLGRPDGECSGPPSASGDPGSE